MGKGRLVGNLGRPLQLRFMERRILQLRFMERRILIHIIAA